VTPIGFERIGGPDDPRVSEYRGISDSELMRARGLFVAEGRLVVQRLIEDGRYVVRSLLLSEAARRSLSPLLATMTPTIPVYIAEAEDFVSITGYDIHRGCLALAIRPDAPSLDDLLAPAATAIVLEGVTNADNVGGVFRNAAAFGADAVLLSPTCCDPLYRKAIRTSMAATLRVPFARLDDWPAALTRIRAQGFALVALTPKQPAEELDAFAARPRPSKLALLIGTEAVGLTPDVEASADHRVRIPIRAGVDSLNLAVATGIALYKLHGVRG
jgi:tRNA G18 (ribose-2'-O)-methylase SpoU